jgi:prepilin-type N-terminal cleavage/methylation domain-containing protein
MDRNNRSASQHGFTIVQMIVALAIISIVSTVAVLGVKSSREHFKMQSSARLFASYCEKARADSVRRHAGTGEEASIEMFGEGTTTYNVTMDFGSGVETRTFQLDPGIQFGSKAKKVTFDWRGRLLGEAEVFQIESIYLNERIPVDVSGSGDVTIWSQFFPDQLIPEVTISNAPDDVDHESPSPSPSVSPSVEPSPSPSPPSDGASPTPTPSPTASASPTATPHGNGAGSDGNNGNNGNNASPTPTATPSPSPSGDLPQCVATISPSTLFLSQGNDPTKLTGTATFTMTNATGVRTISFEQPGNGNSLVLSWSLSRIDGSGSSVLTVTTKNGAGNRGDFTVNAKTDPACGSGAKLTVSVSN